MTMIKRYEMENLGIHDTDNFQMVEDIDGEYVRYEDHMAEVRRLIVFRPRHSYSETVQRNAIIKECWDALDKNIVRGGLPGNGCDKSAERNGMVLASNILAEMMGWTKARYAEDLPSPPAPE